MGETRTLYRSAPLDTIMSQFHPSPFLSSYLSKYSPQSYSLMSFSILQRVFANTIPQQTKKYT
jgi:hypothetical protein